MAGSQVSASFSVVTGEVARDVIGADRKGCVDVVRSAYRMHDEGNTLNPPSVFLKYPDNPTRRIIALPAHLGPPQNISGIKWIASYPENSRSGIPRASAVLVLNECEHGRPFVCMESSVISAARTAASATLAAECLWLKKEKRVKALGFVGNGYIARTICEFLLGTGWHIEELHLYDTEPTAEVEFASWIRRYGEFPRIQFEKRPEDLLRQCELAVFATVASAPHVHDISLLGHNPIILHISLRDLAPDLILQAQNVVDDPIHALSANTSLHLTEQLMGDRGFVTCKLADMLGGKVKRDPSRPAIFSPFGMGILDVAVGKWVYDRAVAAGRSLKIDNFFLE